MLGAIYLCCCHLSAPHAGRGMICTLWVRTPIGYHIHRYGNTLRTSCLLCICVLVYTRHVPTLHMMTISTSTEMQREKLPVSQKCYTDSHILIIDNGCSSSITNTTVDFISQPRMMNVSIEGYNGCTSATNVGTVCWCIEDDTGHKHDILLPNMYYSPQGKHRLSCPQHWAQMAIDHHP
jgi:hypothetical protein